MPKVKLVREKQYKNIPKNIRRLQAIYEISNDEIIFASGICSASFYGRMRNPGMFRSNELENIACKLNTEPWRLYIDPKESVCVGQI